VVLLMKLIVGLGNPGVHYQHTRHNVGFLAIEALIQKYQLCASGGQFNGLVTEWAVGLEKVLLVRPQTFMNLSGYCVRRFVDFYKILLQDVVVVVDDVDLKFGQVRMRERGSSGGQKGLQSLIEHLGTNEFTRLKIGIGRPSNCAQVADYVLRNFDPREQVQLPSLLDWVVAGLEVWSRDGAVSAMNRLNSFQI